MKKFIFLWLFSFVLASNLQAVWDSGNILVDNMREYDKWENGNKDFDFSKAFAYVNYVSGVADTMKSASHICIPDGVNSGQIFAIVTKYIKSNPEKWNQSANQLVFEPLFDTFPCKKEKK